MQRIIDELRAKGDSVTMTRTDWEKLAERVEKLRAARTLHHNGTLVCRECLISEECAKTPENSNCMIMHYDALLEWLGSEVGSEVRSGKLTAEQVEKVVISSDYWERVNNHPTLREGVWQSIADELNKTLGSKPKPPCGGGYCPMCSATQSGGECLISEECAKTPENSNCMIMHYDALLEWLEGETE